MTRTTLSTRAQTKAYARALLPSRAVDPGRFLIFGQGRTGSTLLGSLLDSHPAVHFADEVLYHDMRWPDGWIKGGRRQRPQSVYGIHVKIYQAREQHGSRT